MKTIKLIVLIILLPYISLAQSWQWAKRYTGIDSVRIDMSDFDVNGNLFIIGSFDFYCTFQTDTLWSFGNEHRIFIAKLDNSGNEIWIKQPGGTYLSGTKEDLTFIELDEVDSAIYISGSYSGTLSMDGHSVTSSSTDHFLARLDLNGVCQWIISAGSPVDDEFRNSSFALDGQNNIYWTAEFNANGIINSTNINKGSFLAKVNSAGVIQWARNEFIDIDPELKMNGTRLYFTGTTKGDTCIVDSDTIFNNLNLQWFNPIIGELDLNGNIIWVNKFECAWGGYGASLEFDNSGNLFYCGKFGGTMSINTQQLMSLTYQDGFLVKMDSSGMPINVLQSYTAGGSNKSTSFINLLRKPDGNLYLIGNFNGITNLGTYFFSSVNSFDAFVGLIDENLNWLNVFHLVNATGGNLKQDSNGDLFLGLSFQNSITLGTTTLNASGTQSALIAKSSAITGIGGNERSLQSQLSIYANPNKGSFRIKIPEDIVSYEEATLLVFDQQGREITRFNLSLVEDETPVFDVDKAGPGVYMVQLVQGTKSYWGKMVVE